MVAHVPAQLQPKLLPANRSPSKLKLAVLTNRRTPIGAHMIYDNLWEIVERTDWRLMIVEYKALAIGAFVVAAVLMWNRIRLLRRLRRVENQLKKMEKKVSILEVQEAGRLMRLVKEFSAKSRAKADPRDKAAEIDGGDVVGLAASPPTSPVQGDRAKSAKLPG
jgi:siroheme synthase (precorrin-2 oxidase/ferrochelatase)